MVYHDQVDIAVQGTETGNQDGISSREYRHEYGHGHHHRTHAGGTTYNTSCKPA